VRSSSKFSGTRMLAGLICFLWVAIASASEAEMSENSTTTPTETETETETETATQKPESVTTSAESTEAEVVSSNPKADSAPEDERPKTNTTDEKPTLSERVQIFIPSEEIDTEKAVAFPTNI
jgi:cytoskeletal protein RodZ